MAARYVEAVIGAAGTFTEPGQFLGRVTALIEETSPPWVGRCVLQRRYRKDDSSWSPWLTVAAIVEASANAFIEHEADVQFRLGTVSGLTGGTPTARLSQ